jgi:type IV pilus assembly protein PilF
MPPRKFLFLVAAMVFLVTSCSRLTFVKPSGKRKGPQETARTYHVSDSPAVKQRLAARDRLARATQRLQGGDMAAAEADAKEVLKADPGSADAHTLLAVVNDRRGNQALAGTHYKRAAELAPNQGGVLNNYGAWLCNNGFAAESLVWLDRAVAAPGYASPESALANAGGCALKTGQYARAQRDLRTALEIDPSNPFALASMAESEFRLDRFFGARAFSERRLAAAPATASVLQLAARIEERLGDTKAASRYLQRLQSEFPNDVTAR